LTGLRLPMMHGGAALTTESSTRFESRGAGRASCAGAISCLSVKSHANLSAQRKAADSRLAQPGVGLAVPNLKELYKVMSPSVSQKRMKLA
jgi:hypothetical protein